WSGTGGGVVGHAAGAGALAWPRPAAGGERDLAGRDRRRASAECPGAGAPRSNLGRGAAEGGAELDGDRGVSRVVGAGEEDHVTGNATAQYRRGGFVGGGDRDLYGHGAVGGGHLFL